MFKRTATALTLIATLTAPAFAQDADTVVAKVGDTEITLGQMAALKLTMPPEMAQVPAADLWNVLLDEMIRQAALANEGEKELTALDRAFLANQRRDYLVRSVMERVADFEPTDAEIEAAYAMAFPADTPITEYDADHILLESEDDAKAVIEELNNGGDFTKLAAERSTDTGSAPSGGDLGWFTADRMVPEFSEAVAAMEPGTTSTAPVQSQFGWHVIKLNETREMTPPTVEEIRDALVQQVRREKVSAEIERISGEAAVERIEGIDPTVLDQDILGVQE
ncbi:MAG TPA: peptidylprolyl isomerase [Paracoccus sp. (in: a-proteobacteria)]|uniref:peptidylprolyl isomerase n=1 Tax=uncultured Paracoccus sp. TaxID=189685 RepID=UPI00262B3457|nr:peptidylprolyl isomerase [uncultured Paracoccus sp.]HMQ42176.1 peptidylprolyl isomerase [Paracoccus sp. (in: a-proteobacteria)]HMR37162.1 peptidylprolyl isomerase [Paracoccus sp. (in: a-proteobacteria)]